jgi:hypothetical protein
MQVREVIRRLEELPQDFDVYVKPEHEDGVRGIFEVYGGWTDEDGIDCLWYDLAVEDQNCVIITTW